MFQYKSLWLVVCGCWLTVTQASAQVAETQIKHLSGPATAKLGAVGEINIPKDYIFLDGPTTRQLMKKAGEPSSGRELGLVEPTNGNWSVFFEFNDIGYVKDSEKNDLDADKILASFVKGTEEANKERSANGRPPMTIIGWEVPPKYDEVTHNLEWAIRASSEGHLILNYNTRLLGRKGVMETVLVVAPEDLQATLPEFRNLMAKYQFTSGESYAEYRVGDKIAKYGLGALILGGAAVGAAKLGLLGPLLLILKKCWVFIVAGLAAVARFFKNTFKSFFGRSNDSDKTDKP